MTESGGEAGLTCQFLQSCLRQPPGGVIPQMRLQTNTSLARLGEPESKLNRKNNEPPTCLHCYSPVQLQRANIRLQNVRKSLTLNIHCHVCRREASHEEIIFPRSEPERHQKTKTRFEEGQNRQKAKKKKCKKEKNAGLNIPTASPHCEAPIMKRKMVNSQNKLKHLLATDNSSNKSCLQDFLKKL